MALTFRALRHHNFRLYLFGLMVSLTGTYIQLVAEGWLVYQLTNSALALGVVGFIAMLPMAPWSLVAGALADRMSKKDLLAMSQVGQIFPPLVLAALIWSGYVQVWHVIVVNFIMGTMSTVDQPTRQALVVEVVETEDLVDNALALTALGFNIARVVGPAIAGVLISTIGLEGAFILNGLSFLAVLIALTFMRVSPRQKPAGQASLGANLLEGGRYLLGERTILALIILMVVVSFFILPYQTLLPVFARDILKAGSTGLGFLTAAAGLGAIFGALAMTNVSAELRNKLVVVFVIMVPFVTAGFAFSDNLVLSGLMLLLASGIVVALKTLGFILIQIKTRDELRGRVTSLLLLMMGATPRVGGLALGYLASVLGAPLAMGLSALGCLVCGVMALIAFVPWLRQIT